MSELKLDTIAFKENLNEFNVTLGENGLNLIEEIKTILLDSGVDPARVKEAYTNSPILTELENKIESIQMWGLNRYWIMQLLNVDESTIDVRTHLGYTYTPEGWIAMFRKHILPFALNHHLPKVYNTNW